MEGQVFGRWTVIGPVTRADRYRYWLCRCQCGTERAVFERSLRRGLSRSCGCIVKEGWARPDKRTHGMSTTPTFESWRSMKSRCHRRTDRSFAEYGGRGITVCAAWLTFEGFLADMGERPKGTTLERIDVNGHYEPGNCVWATAKEQGRNKRNSQFLTIEGHTLLLMDWAAAAGIGVSTIRERLRRHGWCELDAVFVPALRKGLETLTTDQSVVARWRFEAWRARGGQIDHSGHPGTVTIRTAVQATPKAEETEDA